MYAERITDTSGKLLGVQILRGENPLTTIEEKRSEICNILREIHSQDAFFKRRDVFCTLPINDSAEAALLTFDPPCQHALAKMPYITLQVKQNLYTAIDELSLGINPVWLGEVGDDTPFTQYCETVVLNETFTSTELQKETFPVLIKNIRRYSDRVVVRATDFNQRKVLHNAGVWGCTGMYPPLQFKKIHLLM